MRQINSQAFILLLKVMILPQVPFYLWQVIILVRSRACYADGEQPLSLLAGSSTVDIGTLEVDATRPTATISNSGHDYVASSGVLTGGDKFTTLGR